MSALYRVYYRYLLLNTVLFALFHVVFITPSPVLAIDPDKEISQYVLDTWGIEEGLPQNSVTAIVRDRKGYLWLGTQEGLVRFDGVRFTVYNKKNAPGILDTWIIALCECRDDMLWIGTHGGGLCSLKDGVFTAYTTEQGLSDDFIWTICSDGEGGVWIGTENGLSHLENGEFTVYTTREGLPLNRVRSLCKDTKGNLWVGTEGGGLARFRDGTFTTYTEKQGLPNDNIYSIHEDRRGDLWVGTYGGLVCFENGLFTARTTYTAKNGLANNYIMLVYEDRDGTLWIGTDSGGLNRFRDGKFDVFTSKEGLSDDSVWAMYEDPEGSLWLGTDGGGLNRMKSGKFTTYTTRQGLSHNMVMCVYESRDGAIWIGTHGGGLNRLKDGKFTTYTKKDGLLDDFIYSLYQDKKGNLWIGTFGFGLNRFANGKFTAYSTEQGFSGDFIWFTYEDRDGRLWFGTSSGLIRLENGVFTTLNTERGLSNDIVGCMVEDKDGTLWIGTDGGGVNRYKDGQFTALTKEQGMPDDVVSTLYLDGEGVLWIGTYEGLVRLKNGTLTTVNADNGLLEDTVFSILDDDNGYLWMSGNKGVSRVSKQQLNDFCDGKRASVQHTSYDEKDGMKSRECNGGYQSAGLKTRGGRLWFPTIKGVVEVDPNKLKINTLPPPVEIEEIVVGNRTFSPPFAPGTPPLVLPPGTDQFEIHYTGLSLLAPERVRFKYLLEEIDTQWHDVDTRRTAYYTKLPPGNYTFRVKAQNNDGTWNETGAFISFYHKPFFHQTAWFYVLCTLAAALTVFTGYRYRVRKLRKRQELLKRLVEKQTAALKERNRELEAMDRVVKTINREIELEKLLQSLLKQAMGLFPQSEMGGFFIYNTEEACFRMVASEGIDPALVKEIAFTYDEAVGRYVRGAEELEKGVYIVREFENAPGREKLKKLPQPQCVLAMEVTLGERIEGFMLLDSLTDPQAFDKSDTQKLYFLREHAISAIYKARNLEQLQEEKDKTEDALARAREAHQELEKAKEAVEKAHRAKSDFLANMSHEIRTPINAILGFTEIMSSEIKEERHKGFLEAVSSSGKTLLGLLNDILDLSRIEAGKMELKFEPLNPRSVLKELEQIFSRKAESRGIEFHLEVDPGLPQFLLLDGLRLRQVLLNLVGNAVRFTNNGFIKLSVKRESGLTGDATAGLTGTATPGLTGIVFSVEDSGIGIPEDQQQRIFDAFEQQDGQSRRYGGTGLGLAITLRLVELMGGDISVHSQKGKGSTFVVTLKNVAIPGGAVEEVPGSDIDIDAVRFGKASVLVVDGKELNRRLLIEYLSHSPIECIETGNGREAVELAVRHRPDLVLMGIKNFEVDGYEAARQIKAHEELKETPVIILTASSLKSEEEEIRKAGIDGGINKPVSKRELYTQLMRFLPHTAPGPVESPPAAPPISAEVRAKLPGLIEILQREDLTKRWEKISRTFIIDEVEAFAKEMKALDGNYGSGILSRWSDRLFNQVQTYDIEKIQRVLASFPEVVNKIEKILS